MSPRYWGRIQKSLKTWVEEINRNHPLNYSLNQDTFALTVDLHLQDETELIGDNKKAHNPSEENGKP